MNAHQSIAAVHYYYLLKDDEDDLGRLWASLTSEVRGKVELPLSLGLPGSGEESAGFCRIVNHIRGEGMDLCLVLLSDLTVLQIMYEVDGGQDLRDRWEDALLHLQSDRDRVTAAGLTIFGETTLLLAPADAGDKAVGDALRLAGGDSTLSSDIDPAAAGGQARLVSLLGGDTRRDFYLLVADDADKVISILFPQVDSVIKKLERTSSYFEGQRKTIQRERSQVDRDIGALLHQQVVSVHGEKPNSARLEEQIESLSRMFGMLATDSLLVRQAGDRLERDVSRLQLHLDALSGGGSANGIRSHFMGLFQGELNAARDEAQNLDFSRRNAQAAIEVVRTQVELLRAGEDAAMQEQTKQLLTRSVVLQKERLTLQAAAAFVEFVLLFYYVLKGWEGVAGTEPVEHLSPLVRLLLVGGFSLSATLGSHFLAKTLQTRSLKNTGLIISAAGLVSAFTAMIILTVVNS